MADDGLEPYYFNPEPQIICGELVPPITESHDFDVDNYPKFVDRYFTKRYYFRNDNADEAHIVLSHSNGICLIGLAETHIAVKKGMNRSISQLHNNIATHCLFITYPFFFFIILI